MADRAGRNWAWGHFWRSGRTASCVPANPDTEREIEAIWLAFFGGLADGSRVLDVATGNGAVLRQAAAVATPGRRFALVGIDAAEIDPLMHAPDDFGPSVDVRFSGGVDAASLPFEDASFDCVVSQYGLEYADLPRAFAEVERVLRPGGWLHWLAHGEASEVVRQHRSQHEQVDLLLASGGPVECMERLVERIGRRRSVKLAMSRLGRALNQAERYCREHPPASIVTEVCSGLADTASRFRAYDPGDLRSMVARTRRELTAHRQRILDLGDAVITPGREAWLRRRLAGPAWETASVAVVEAGSTDDVVGLLVTATRGGGSAPPPSC